MINNNNNILYIFCIVQTEVPTAQYTNNYIEYI